ncbi:unnamed protein product, partial [Effrenium voratum]
TGTLLDQFGSAHAKSIIILARGVITAVFLKDTLDAAHNDAEHQLAEGIRKKAQYVQKLESIFEAIDETGNGMITEERLNQILENPRVKAYFETLDLAVHEGTALFHILDNGDGEVTLEEFIDGILRCKGPARAIDQVAMHADLKKLEEKLMQLADNLNSKKASDESKETSKKRRKDRMRSITNDLKVFRLEESIPLGHRFSGRGSHCSTNSELPMGQARSSAF